MRTLTFRGNKNRKNYFEGWYFKFIDPRNDLFLILIPGISNFSKKLAFLQYIIHHKGKVSNGFMEYSFHDFIIEQPFKLLLPHGSISDKEVCLHFENISINLTSNRFTPIKTSPLSPSIMGYFEYLRMPCYHDIISLNHTAYGKVSLDKETIFFHGKGYIEGDRGKNFPESYLWAQCNHFSNENDSLFLSVADISTPLFKFLGHIAIYYHEGKEYRFASYLGSKVSVSVNPDKTRANLLFKDKKHRLDVRIKLTDGNTLIAPMNKKMDFKIKEQVKSKIKLSFDGKVDESDFCASELVNWT